MSKNNRLTLEQVANKIKGLVTTSALAKIEIGELLIEYKKDIEHGGLTPFYESIGMSERTGQYYMEIARHEEVQKRKKEGKLEGLNMQDLLVLIGARVNRRGDDGTSKDVKKVEYKRVPVDSFDYMKCKSTKVFKVQYELLSNKVSELETKLKDLQSKSA